MIQAACLDSLDTSVRVVLAFSGGGTRAAAPAYGVLDDLGELLLSIEPLTKVPGLRLQPVLRSFQLHHPALELLPGQYLLADVADRGDGVLPSAGRTDANLNGEFQTVASRGQQLPPGSYGGNGGVDEEFRPRLRVPLPRSLGEERLDLDTYELAWLVAEETPGVLVRELDRAV